MSKGPKGVFWQQKHHAKARGIEFCFSYEEWALWWETNLGPNWLKRRGCRRGQYVMARHGDKGPYAAWNVKCITSEENCIERIKISGLIPGPIPRGELNASAKLTEAQVLEILSSKESYGCLAAKYKTSKDRIYCIKAGRSWKYLTKR